MRGLRKPDLKAPEVRVPGFVADVYHDLRERRLLPLVALLIVATAAVPFLLREDKAEEPVAPATAGDAPAAEAAASETLAVVQATPGLRDYRKRLKNRTPTDPFVQKFRGLPPGAKLKVSEPSGGSGEGAPGGGSGEGSPLTPGGGEGVAPGGSGDQGSSGGSGSGGSGKSGGNGRPTSGKPHGRLFAYRPKVRFGVAGSHDLNVYDELSVGTLLPKRNPVVIFLGVSDDGKRAAFSVTREVAFVRGDGRCIGGPKNCGLLLLKEGEAVDLLTGKPNRDFRLKVQRIDLVEIEEMSKKAESSAAKAAFRLDWGQSFSK